MNLFIPIFCSSFFLTYMAIAFVWPTVRTWKKTGVNPLVFGNSGSAHDYIGRVFKIVVSIPIPFTIIIYWINSSAYSYLLPAGYLQLPISQITGVILCLLSFLWTGIAQWQMGSSWRIGIDQEHKTPLIRVGLFKISRNPIFLGMLFTLLGFFLLLPNAITFATLVAAYLLIQIQIRQEEAFLRVEHGELYKDYQQQTRRLL